MFHQSVCGLKKYPAEIELNAEERYKYLDPDFYELLTILMIEDSHSYTIIRKEESK